MNDEPQGQIDTEAMSTPEPSTDELPQEASERTREQFEKLKAKNKELSEQLRQQEAQKPSVLDELYPEEPKSAPQPQGTFQVPQFSNLNQQQVQQIQDDFTYTGDDGYKYIDQAKLQSALKEANERAEKAIRSAQIAQDSVRKYEETQQVRETYKEYPQLNPNHKDFDADFYELVKGELMTQAMRGEKNLMKAAKLVDSRINKYRGGIQDQQKVQTQKEQINATINAPRGVHSSADNDYLVRATQRGEPGALAERLKRSGF